METTKTIKFDLVRTLLFIKDNAILTRVLNKRYNVKFEEIFNAIKEGRFKPEAIEYIKGIFEATIASDGNMLKTYNAIKIPNELVIDDISVPETIQEAICSPEEDTEVETIESLVKLARIEN
jgi:hypothetical protein